MKKIIAILVMFISSYSMASDTEVIVKAKRAIKDGAKDPSSVEFKQVYYNYTEAGGRIACGQFNAKNSFGAYVGFTRFISNGKTTSIDGNKDSEPPFPELWVMLCLKNS